MRLRAHAWSARSWAGSILLTLVSVNLSAPLAGANGPGTAAAPALSTKQPDFLAREDDISPYKPSLRAASATPAILEEVAAEFLKPGVTNLAAGYSYWGPPPECLKKAEELIKSNDPSLHKYGDCLGLPELREKLREKLKKENQIEGKEIMVTAGANQAFMNVVLALCDVTDSVVLFAPYYFSHKAALELAGVEPLFAPCDEEMNPDVLALPDFLEGAKEAGKTIKMVVLTSPSNPSGAVISKQQLKQLQQICKSHGCWLVSDETYEYFTFGGVVHNSPTAADGVVNIYSFSKSYGMAGWRVGYVVYPHHISSVMLKAQDTIPTMPTILSQRLALASLEAGADWVRKKVESLELARNAFWDAFEPLGTVYPKGAYYYFLKLPSMLSETGVIRLLAEKHQILAAPGSAFGTKGHLRISYGPVNPEAAEEVGVRLTKAMADVVRLGLKLSFEEQMGNPISAGTLGPWGPLLESDTQLIERETRRQEKSGDNPALVDD